MAQLEVGDILKVQIYCRLGNQVSVNVRHFNVIDTEDVAPSDQQAADQISTAVSALYLPLLNNVADYLGVKAQIIFPELGGVVESQLEAGDGEAGAEAMSAQTCGLIKLLTNQGGRIGRGRLYIPFPSETHNDANGKPVAGYITLAQDLGNFFVGTTIVTNALLGTATLASSVVNPSVNTAIPITSSVVRTDWATQRRRSQINKPDAPPF